jgi:Cof subfamily protein (haloacid dehalogenase superfamily)
VRPSPGRYRLLVTDIDGTLVAENQGVPPGVVEAVRRVQARGVRVCVATGRMWDAARPFVEALGADPPAILYNGALVYDFATGRKVWIGRLPRDHARRVLEVLRDFPWVSPLLFVHGQVHAERMTPGVQRFARRDGLTVRVVPRFAELLTEDPVKILIVGEPEDLALVSQALQSLPGIPVNQVFSQADYLEILPPDISKGRALPVLAEHLGVSLGETVAVGDNLNDLTMLQAAGLGVAVEGSPPELLAAARWVCPRPEKEGLRVLIERVFIGDVTRKERPSPGSGVR